MISYIERCDVLGFTDPDVAGAISGLTNAAILCGDIENFLMMEDLAKRDAVTGAWEGTLIDVINAGGALGEGLEELFSHLNKPRSIVVDSADVVWSVKLNGLLLGLQAGGIITAEQADDFVAMGGGLKFGPQTPADIEQARSDAAAEDAAQAAEDARIEGLQDLEAEIMNNWINPAVSGVDDAATVRAAIKSGL